MDTLKKKNGNKYLILDSPNKKKVLQNYAELCDAIKNYIEKVNNKLGEYGKDFMKIKFNSDDNLPLNKIIKRIWKKMGIIMSEEKKQRLNKSYTCEEGGAFIDELEKQIIIKKTIEVGQ